jgi:hypothetical protein
MNTTIEEAKQFVYHRLVEWTEHFPGLHLRYYFEPCSDVHIVEVKPESFHNSNEAFIQAQLALIHTIQEKFPNHGMICFTESDSAYLLGEGTIELRPSFKDGSTKVA